MANNSYPWERTKRAAANPWLAMLVPLVPAVVIGIWVLSGMEHRVSTLEAENKGLRASLKTVRESNDRLSERLTRLEIRRHFDNFNGDNP
ncbi:MAG: hypothetical protein ACR2RF_24815 [Geminicoccaceae bacterium]